jgi:hypothetical protein
MRHLTTLLGHEALVMGTDMLLVQADHVPDLRHSHGAMHQG